jgi:hypothetical protein
MELIAIRHYNFNRRASVLQAQFRKNYRPLAVPSAGRMTISQSTEFPRRLAIVHTHVASKDILTSARYRIAS